MKSLYIHNNNLKDQGYPFVIAMIDQEEICTQLQNDAQIYYDGIESWIKDYQGDDNDLIKMCAVYRNMEQKKVIGGKENENRLDNLDKEIYTSIHDLNLDKAVKIYGGICPCCKEKPLFIAFDYWLRDYYKCLFCGSIPRQRALMKVLEKEMPNWKDMKIHESSPNGNILRMFREQCAKYTYSYWYEDKAPSRELQSGSTNQNLENLTKVLMEISRTLKKVESIYLRHRYIRLKRQYLE